MLATRIQSRSFQPLPHYALSELEKYSFGSGKRSGRDECGETADLFCAPHKHTLWIITRGSGWVGAGTTDLYVSAGSCLRLAPGTGLRLETSTIDSLELYRLLYDTSVDGQEPDQYPAEVSELSPDILPLLEGRLERLLQADRESGTPELLNTHILFQQIMLLILNEYGAGAGGRDWTSDGLKEEWKEAVLEEHEAAVEQSIAGLHAAYREPIRIGELAQDVHMSRWQYGHLFKSLTGRTPTDYLTALRIGLSKQLLIGEESPASPLRDIAGRVGFQDEYYFSRRFKQMAGCSPSAYRAAGGPAPRIVCLQYLGELLALGVRPAAASRTMLHLLHEHAAGITALDDPLDAEALTALAPELILYPSFLSPALARGLRRIAPALEISWQDDIRSRLRKLGALLGREQAAEDWITRYGNRAAYWRSKLKDRIGPGETASAFAMHHGLYVYAGHHFGHTLYHGLQFVPPEQVGGWMEREPGQKWKRISPEQLAEYAGDRVFMALSPAGPDAAEALRLMASPAWRNLPAVRAGRSHVIDLSLANYNPLTLDAHLETVGALLLAE